METVQQTNDRNESKTPDESGGIGAVGVTAKCRAGSLRKADTSPSNLKWR